MRFLFPLDGDCINKNDGILTDGGILIEARVSAPAEAEIFIGGERAKFSDGVWSAKVLVSDYKTILAAEDASNGGRKRSLCFASAIPWVNSAFPRTIISSFCLI